MTKKGPGKSFREGLTLLKVADMFRDEDRAREWIAYVRWPHGPCCPECGSLNVQSGIKHHHHGCALGHHALSHNTLFLFDKILDGTVPQNRVLRYIPPSSNRPKTYRMGRHKTTLEPPTPILRPI